MSRERTYEVSGIDDLGDVHTFGTNDKGRAEEIAELMAEDLDEVQLREST